MGYTRNILEFFQRSYPIHLRMTTTLSVLTALAVPPTTSSRTLPHGWVSSFVLGLIDRIISSHSRPRPGKAHLVRGGCIVGGFIGLCSKVDPRVL